MDLSKMKNDRKLFLCRWYYRAGFAFLPFLNKKYVIMSKIGAIIWTTGLTAWITIFQLNRAEWDKAGDQISFMIPTGIP
ncbi:hypothetical protein L9F63_003803 [Diploptera punctata]|uniref:Uncharacterized protein n=1 Tax=Diploptera punctata TaxID=6984 RepID=A0AAD8E998_DIPPU|nr:hypothetical protein L9F63_003803 [Diploptera punctata]